MMHLSQTIALSLGFTLVFAGCVTTTSAPQDTPSVTLGETLSARSVNYVPQMGGHPIGWEAMVAKAAESDIIVVAEQHDDPVAHRIQTALVKELASSKTLAVCMEMFERHEQPFVDAYLSDTIAQKTLVDLTDSRDWGAKGMWDTFYQPTVDAAKEHGSPVIAANAPRPFTRLGRLEGFETLAKFLDAYPGQYAVPAAIDDGAYSERFKDTMRHHSPMPATKSTKKSAESSHAMPAMTEDMLASFFRAQQVWDATMAESVVRAFEVHGKALLLVGQFHTDHDGGLLLRMKAAKPDARILTISVQKEIASELREEDRGRADIVVYRPE